MFDPSTRTGRWIVAQMEEHGINQLALSHKSGVAQGYLHGILHLDRIPGRDKLEDLARAFRRPPSALLLLAALDRIQGVLGEAPADVQRRLRPLYDALAKLDRE